MYNLHNPAEHVVPWIAETVLHLVAAVATVGYERVGAHIVRATRFVRMWQRLLLFPFADFEHANRIHAKTATPHGVELGPASIFVRHGRGRSVEF